MGKTLTSENIALQLCDEEGYSIVPCNSVKDIKKRYKNNARQVFFVDDICGKYTANITYIENWMQIEEFVNFILRKGQTKILATCRTEIVKHENLEKTLKSCLKLFNLTRSYSFEDKMKLARKYPNADEEMLTDIVEKVEFSPIMCFLYSKHDDFDVNAFLNSPYKTFSDEWDTLKMFDKKKFCVLLLCVIYNGTINETMFDVLNDFDKEEKRKQKVIFECCNLGRETPRSTIKYKLNACVGTYFIKVDREYKVIHDKMFDFLCDYFGKALIAPILKYADDKLISERVQLESIQKAHSEFTIIVSSTDEQKYIDRVKMDLTNGKIHWCLNNVQMRYKEYRVKFVNIVNNLDDGIKSRLIDTKDDNGINSFIIACMRGYEELVDFFISVGADVNARNGWFTPLNAACRDGHVGTVEILLNKGSIVNQTNVDGETPLYTACICGYYGLVKLLIERNVKINQKNKYDRTPLYVSCLGGFESIVRILIDKGANIYDSLIGATHGGHDKIVETLITEDCNLNIVDVQGRTALFIACEEGYTKIVTLLINKFADIFKANSDGKTPLDAAFSARNNEIVNILIKNKADVIHICAEGETDISIACYKGFGKQAVLANVADVCEPNEAGLDAGVRAGNDEVVHILMKNNADVNIICADGETPMTIACKGYSKQPSLAKGTDVNDVNRSEVIVFPSNLRQRDGQGIDVMTMKKSKLQIEQYDIEYIDGCLERKKKKPNQKPEQNTGITRNWLQCGWTPLYEACMRGDITTVKSLIKSQANVNMKTVDDETPLLAACHQDNITLIDILLNEGADINQALCIAVQGDYDKAVEILLNKGGDLGYKGHNGKSLMRLACEYGSTNVFKLLLKKGADVNERDKDGRYLLYVSMFEGFDEISECLVLKGIPIARSNEDKFQALDSVFNKFKRKKREMKDTTRTIANEELLGLLISKGYTDNIPIPNTFDLYEWQISDRLRKQLNKNKLKNTVFDYARNNLVASIFVCGLFLVFVGFK